MEANDWDHQALLELQQPSLFDTFKYLKRHFTTGYDKAVYVHAKGRQAFSVVGCGGSFSFSQVELKAAMDRHEIKLTINAALPAVSKTTRATPLGND